MMMRGAGMLLGAAWLSVAAAVAACGGADSRGYHQADSAGGVAARRGETSAAMATGVGAGGRSFAPFGNRIGRIPVREYHVGGDSTRGQFIISRQKFDHGLQRL